MGNKTIAAVFATLTTTSLTLACDKTTSELTNVPTSSEDPEPAAGEHSCGNHEAGACGADMDDSESDAAVPATRTFGVEPDGFAEVNFTMAKGSQVTVTFSKGSSEFAWNVHSHEHSGGTKIHQEGSAREGTVVFVAPEDGVFSVLWKNDEMSATPLEVSVALGDGATIHSWAPAQ